MEKLWLKSYPSGVPADIDPNAYNSLVELLEEACEQYSDLPAFANMGQKLSYAELEVKTRAFAAYCKQVLQLKKGDRLAIMLPNTLQYAVVLFGALRAGLTIVNVNPLYTATELQYQLSDSGAKAIVVMANFASELEKALPQTAIKYVIVTELGDLFPFPRRLVVNWVVRFLKKMVPAWRIPQAKSLRAALTQGERLHFERVSMTPEDIAFLQYTGGTTGVSKGAILTHQNMVANVEQAAAWIKPRIESGKEIVVTALPLYHIFSLLANCLTFIKYGAMNVLITNPRDIPRFITELSKVDYTVITGVNTLFNALLHDSHFAMINHSFLKITLGGGMAVQQVVAEQWQRVTGAPLLEAYGLTETSPAVTINPMNLNSFNGSIGLPIPSTEISIRDDYGHERPLGEPGELCVRGPQVMRGYWCKPEETSKVFTRDGWLLTGDIATVDKDGFVRIVDRKKDMIIVSGFNVYPNEVEEVIVRCPGVREVAVIGIPDEHSGEALKAFVVRDLPSLTEEAIFHFCEANLTRYKIPKAIEFRHDLPKTNVGKILRRELRKDSP